MLPAGVEPAFPSIRTATNFEHSFRRTVANGVQRFSIYEWLLDEAFSHLEGVLRWTIGAYSVGNELRKNGNERATYLSYPLVCAHLWGAPFHLSALLFVSPGI